MGTRTISLHPRYYSRYPAGEVEPLETNGRYEMVDWELTLSETALVCVDIWDRDVQRDLHDADERIVAERIAPLVAACREAGMPIVHAPAPPVARRHGNYVGRDYAPQPAEPASDDWPPEEFRQRRGRYAWLARPDDERRLAAWKALDAAEFHPDVQPQGDEPVIATGAELHRLCRDRGWLHLVYVGFHTPGCMTGRSYGIDAMLRRGYTIMLIRNATNSLETHETLSGKVCLAGGIAILEQTGVLTLTADELAAALTT